MWELLRSVPWWGCVVLCFVAWSLFEFICNTAQHTLADENECERPKSLINFFFSGRKK